jgi:hypothetical protein
MNTKPWLATYRENSIPETINADAWPSVVHLLDDAMQRYADKPAFSTSPSARSSAAGRAPAAPCRSTKASTCCCPPPR